MRALLLVVFFALAMVQMNLTSSSAVGGNSQVITGDVNTTLKGMSTDVEKAADESIKDGKPMLILVTATWCSPCQQLKVKMYKNRELIKKGYRFSLVDYDVNHEMAKKLMTSSSVPQLIIIKKVDGKWYKFVKVGNVSETTLIDFLKKHSDEEDE